MDDFSIWWYLIAAVIYFITRNKKKGAKKREQNQGDRPKQNAPKKSFEELLKEITEGTLGQESDIEEEERIPEPVQVSRKEKKVKPNAFEEEGRKRAFADDESRRVYEESIKMAEGADLAFEPDEDYKNPRLFRNSENEKIRPRSKFAEEIRNGLKDPDSAKRAIIYSEILSRKY